MKLFSKNILFSLSSLRIWFSFHFSFYFSNNESNKLRENLIPWRTCDQTKVQTRVRKSKRCYNIANNNSHCESCKKHKKRKGESHTTQFPNLSRVKMGAKVHKGYFCLYDVKQTLLRWRNVDIWSVRVIVILSTLWSQCELSCVQSTTPMI